MVVRIHNVGKWSVLAAGKILELKGEGHRKVRLQVNCPAPTRLDVIEGEKGTFLAVVQGLETIEFSASADAYILATTDEDISYFTNQGDQISTDRPEAVSFTTIASRRSRNPELEMMMFKAEQNIKRRLDHLAAEQEAWREAQEAATPHDPETGEVIDGENGSGAGSGAASEAAGGGGGSAELPAAGKGGGAAPAAGVAGGSPAA